MLLVYRFAIGKGVEVTNPVDSIQRKTNGTFQPRERNLDRREIKTFFDTSTRPRFPRCAWRSRDSSASTMASTCVAMAVRRPRGWICDLEQASQFLAPKLEGQSTKSPFD